MTMLPNILRATLGTALLLAAAPAFSDEPGPGGTKTPKPVTGEQVYRAICQACHMANGEGGSGAATIPALANNPKLEDAAYPINLVAHGRGAMPWLNDTLDTKQITAVVGYVRTHFGNSYTAPVSEAMVAKLAGKAPGSER